MDGPSPLVRKALDQRLPNPVVIELESLAPASTPQEVLARQRSDERPLIAPDLRAIARDDRVKRMCGDRQSLEEPPRVNGKRGQVGVQDFGDGNTRPATF